MGDTVILRSFVFVCLLISPLLLLISSQKMATHRWIVTYTKHMKQKRKVYQDGVLELCSSTGTPQVMLYDERERLVDRRFLKKYEIIKSGGILSFETHIVEIGDPDGSKMPSSELNVKPCIQPESQKEKITLLNEDGAVLSSKYLKSVACLESDVNFEFPNYLVNVCERRDSAANQDLNHSKKVTNNCSSKVGKLLNTTAPLRDAWHILSVLKKPSPEGNLIEVLLMEQDLTLQSTDNCQLDLQDKCGVAPLNVPLLNSVQPADDCHEELSAFSSEITGTSARHGLKSTDSQGPRVSADILVLDTYSGGSSSVDDHSSSSWLSGMDTKSILSYSAPRQLCTKVTKAVARCETSSYTSALSSVHATSDAAKDPEVLNSPELANMKDFPTFDLGF